MAGGVYKETKKVADIKPIVPDYIGDDKETGTGGVISTFSSRTLRFDFNITGQVGKTYRVKLLVDKNNDGVYEDVGSGALDENNEVYYSKDVKLTSRTMNYKINAGLAESFIGMLAWRLEVIQLDEEGKQTPYKVTETDYSAIRNEKIRKLKVLQIAPEKQSKGNYLELNTGSFSTLMNAVESVVGYDMEVTLISTSDFVAKYTSKNKYTKGNIGVEGVDRLYDYNMVVLGFKDSYGGRDINNNYGALDNILDYMDAGKAVLFTHDTVSWRSTPNYKSGYYDSSNKLKILSPGSIYDIKVDGKTGSQTQYGDTCFNLTINFRNRVGMDKYGVTLTAAERAAQGKEVPMYAPSSDTDTQYRPSYMKTDVVREIQGFNNWNTGRMNFCFNVSNGYIENKNSNNYYWSAPYVDNSYDNSDSGSVMYKTKKVVQLNKGPITMYPYNVGVNVDIAETHGQYFELDMEDEDIVVWYTLDAGSSYYTRTYKDAGNNYYIYSKNNITYSGAGHENMGGSSLELKLFVNTIVKAIAGGNSAPVITVTNGGETVNDYVVYVSSSDKADEYEIDFKADDADLVSLETTGGDISLVGEFKKAEVFYWDKDLDKWDSIKVYQAEKDANGKKIKSGLKNGIIQELRLKDTSLTAEQKNKIQAAVQADEGPRFKIVVEDSAGISDTVFITLKVRDLFELD